ncbi:MAG: VOC family protein [Nitrospirae bacterium]|nr:VOC family protein [Nitrospirota bacterium]
MKFGFHHIAVQTRDLAKAIRFYRDAMGFSILKEETSPKGRKIIWFEAGGARIELYSGKPGQPLKDRWDENGIGPLSIGFTVPDLRLAIDRLKIFGARIIREPYEPVPGERAAMIEGPDGEEIVLVDRAVHS